MKGNLNPYYRYRIENYRLFYLIDNNKLLVAAVDLKRRQSAYD